MESELAGIVLNDCKNGVKSGAKLDFVRVSGEFELVGFYCILSICNSTNVHL